MELVAQVTSALLAPPHPRQQRCARRGNTVLEERGPAPTAVVGLMERAPLWRQARALAPAKLVHSVQRGRQPRAPMSAPLASFVPRGPHCPSCVGRVSTVLQGPRCVWSASLGGMVLCPPSPRLPVADRAAPGTTVLLLPPAPQRACAPLAPTACREQLCLCPVQVVCSAIQPA